MTDEEKIVEETPETTPVEEVDDGKKLVLVLQFYVHKIEGSDDVSVSCDKSSSLPLHLQIELVKEFLQHLRDQEATEGDEE